MDATTTPSIEAAVGHGISDLMKISPVVTVLTLSIIVLCLFIRELLKDARNERQLNRDAYKDSTAVIAGLTSMVSELKGTLNALATKL